MAPPTMRPVRSTSNSTAYYFREGRTVYSAFLEFNMPLISPEMDVPLVQSFSLDVSGRYDNYSDVGDTENPKVAFDWVITDGFKAARLLRHLLRGAHRP